MQLNHTRLFLFRCTAITPEQIVETIAPLIRRQFAVFWCVGAIRARGHRRVCAGQEITDTSYKMGCLISPGSRGPVTVSGVRVGTDARLVHDVCDVPRVWQIQSPEPGSATWSDRRKNVKCNFGIFIEPMLAQRMALYWYNVGTPSLACQYYGCRSLSILAQVGNAIWRGCGQSGFGCGLL